MRSVQTGQNGQTDTDNELWRRHSEDEAVTRAVQQESAGQEHHPVAGPPPYGNAQVNLIAAEIGRRERERCASLVEAWPLAPGATGAELLREIAQHIRQLP